MKKLLFVCTGNTCRSPMAAAIAKDKLQDIEVKSAGVFAANGSPASANTVEALRENGIAIDHTSQGLTDELVNWADYIFTMTESHKQLVVDYFPAASTKTHTMKEFAYGIRGDVIDPYGGSLAVYRETYTELNKMMDALVQKLNKE